MKYISGGYNNEYASSESIFMSHYSCIQYENIVTSIIPNKKNNIYQADVLNAVQLVQSTLVGQSTILHYDINYLLISQTLSVLVKSATLMFPSAFNARYCATCISNMCITSNESC